MLTLHGFLSAAQRSETARGNAIPAPLSTDCQLLPCDVQVADVTTTPFEILDWSKMVERSAAVASAIIAADGSLPTSESKGNSKSANATVLARISAAPKSNAVWRKRAGSEP